MPLSGEELDSSGRPPDGIAAAVCRQSYWTRHASAISILILGSLLGFALAGFAGGSGASLRSAEFGAAKLSIRYPEVLRNGELFEMLVTLEARQKLHEVTLAVEPALWRHMTINTIMPAASEESYGRGGIRFTYGAVGAGEKLVVKIDGQINPRLLAGTRGAVALYDGDNFIGDVALSIKVWP